MNESPWPADKTHAGYVPSPESGPVGPSTVHIVTRVGPQ